MPSKPNKRSEIFDVLTALGSTLTSFVWRIHSITGIPAAFRAGIYAEIRIVTKLIIAAAISAGTEIDKFKGTLLYKTLPKYFAAIESTSFILGIPIIIPIGIPTAPMQSPSNSTDFLSCFSVAPTDISIPNWRVRSFSEIVNEL